jgi:hypothetical protein
MSVVDAIAALPRVNAGSPFDTLPVRNWSGGNILKQHLVTFSSILPLNIPLGDYNFDGKADAADLAVWRADYGSTVKAEADGNGDGVVNGADLLVWQRSSGQNFGAPAAAIPEPAAAALVFFASLSLAIYHRLQKRLASSTVPVHGGVMRTDRSC